MGVTGLWFGQQSRALAVHLVTFKCLATESKITPNAVIENDPICLYEPVTAAGAGDTDI